MKYIYLIALTLLPIVINSQSSDLGNWLLYFGNKQINNKLNWHNEV